MRSNRFPNQRSVKLVGGFQLPIASNLDPAVVPKQKNNLRPWPESGIWKNILSNRRFGIFSTPHELTEFIEEVRKPLIQILLRSFEVSPPKIFGKCLFPLSGRSTTA